MGRLLDWKPGQEKALAEVQWKDVAQAVGGDGVGVLEGKHRQSLKWVHKAFPNRWQTSPQIPECQGKLKVTHKNLHPGHITIKY